MKDMIASVCDIVLSIYDILSFWKKNPLLVATRYYLFSSSKLIDMSDQNDRIGAKL